MIQEKLEEQGVKIPRILNRIHKKINLHEGILKLAILINHELVPKTTYMVLDTLMSQYVYYWLKNG
jgi:hypothetical protein